MMPKNGTSIPRVGSTGWPLVHNLLDMSRLQAGALSVFPRPAGLDDIVARALDDLGTPRAAVKVDIPALAARGPG